MNFTLPAMSQIVASVAELTFVSDLYIIFEILRIFFHHIIDTPLLGLYNLIPHHLELSILKRNENPLAISQCLCVNYFYLFIITMNAFFTGIVMNLYNQIIRIHHHF